MITLLASCDTSTNANSVNSQKNDVASHFNSCDLRNPMLPSVTILASYDTGANTNIIKWPENTMLHLISVSLTCTMQWYHWWCWWHHVIPVQVSLPSNYQKFHVASHFDCAVVSLPTVSTSHDTKAGPNGVTWPKTLCCTAFWSSWTKECSVPINDAVHITWCQCQWSGITWHQHQCHCHCVMPVLMLMASHDKSLVTPHFNWLGLRNETVTLIMLLTWCDTDASAIGIKLPKCHVAPHFNCPHLRNAEVLFIYHWHDLIPTTVPVLHLILIILT